MDDDDNLRASADANVAYDDDDNDRRGSRTHKRRRSLSDDDEEDSDSDSRRRQRTSVDDDERRAAIDDVDNTTSSKRSRPHSSNTNGDDIGGGRNGHKTNKVCFAFQRGQCSRGTQCRFAHITPPTLPSHTPPPQPQPQPQPPQQPVFAHTNSRTPFTQTQQPSANTMMLQSGLRIAAPPLPTTQHPAITQPPITEHQTNAFPLNKDYFASKPTTYPSQQQQRTHYEQPQYDQSHRRYNMDHQYSQQHADSYYSTQSQQTQHTQRTSPPDDQMHTPQPLYQEQSAQSFDPPFTQAPLHTQTAESSDPSQVPVPSTSARGRGGTRGRGRHIVRSNSKSSSSGAAKLLVTHIPSEHNNLVKLTTHFAQFGNVIGIAVKSQDSALIEYSTHEEANAAYAHPAAVFDNRFIQVNWYDESSNSQHSSQPPVKTGGGRSAFDVAKKIASNAVSPVPSPSAKPVVVSALEIAQQLKQQQQGISQAPSPPPSTTSAAAVAKSIESLRRRQQQFADLTALFAKTESAMDEGTRTMMQSKIAAIREEIDKHNSTAVAPAVPPLVETENVPFHPIQRARERGRGVPAYRGVLRGATRGRVSISSRGRGHAVVVSNGGQPQTTLAALRTATANGKSGENSIVLLRNIPIHLQSKSALSTLYGAFGEIVSVVCPIDGDAQSARIHFETHKSAERTVANGAIKGIKVEYDRQQTAAASDSVSDDNVADDEDDIDGDEFAILLNTDDDSGDAAVEAAAIIAEESTGITMLDAA